jgi:hypothetical protein
MQLLFGWAGRIRTFGMLESESSALPLGDSPINTIYEPCKHMACQEKNWLGWKDSNLRNAGVRIQCLTTWRQPNERYILYHANTRLSRKNWLGWKDSNLRNAGVRIQCLTTWRQPNERYILYHSPQQIARQFLQNRPIIDKNGISSKKLHETLKNISVLNRLFKKPSPKTLLFGIPLGRMFVSCHQNNILPDYLNLFAGNADIFILTK